MKNRKQNRLKKTVSFKGLTSKGSFAATSLQDMRIAGRKAGEALKRM